MNEPPKKRAKIDYFRDNIPSFSIQITHVNDLNYDYDLKENDWHYISEFLHDSLLQLLPTLTSSSFQVMERITKIPWVLLLHRIDDDTQRAVVQMVADGKNAMKLAMFCLGTSMISACHYSLFYLFV